MVSEMKADANAHDDSPLPPPAALSSPLRSFLNLHFQSPLDLSHSSSLLDRLSHEILDSEDRLSHLRSSIASLLSSWTSGSASTASSLSSISCRLQDFEAQGPDETLFDSPDFIGHLPALAAEVARVENVRLYANTALQLEALIGDLEDAVSAIVIGTPTIQLPRKMANSPAPEVLIDLSSKFSAAIVSLQKIEDVIWEKRASRPQWKRLLVAADIRVDKAMASLRPYAIADYRSKLAVVGWPPPISVVVQKGGHANLSPENPLIKLNNGMKEIFEKSFISLCTLQAIQCRRKVRKSGQVSCKIQEDDDNSHDHDLLWTIEEMIAPISSKVAVHFCKWSEKPDLIFGLAYRLAQQLVDSVDTVLQPILDQVKLAGYCVRWEWISGMVTMVVNHLQSHTLPELMKKFSEDEITEEELSFWLHVVDLVIAFDKRMHNLASIGPLASKMELNLVEGTYADIISVVKCVSVFAEGKEQFDMWTRLELEDAKKKLGRELQQERAWSFYCQSNMISSTASSLEEVEHKHPQGAEVAMRMMWKLIDRCRSLPRGNWKLTFVRNVGAPFLKCFVENLVQRCEEAEAMTALIEDDAVLKVVSCINASNFCENQLREWSDDPFFLDLLQLQISLASSQSNLLDEDSVQDLISVPGSLFDEEISALIQFRNEWLHKLVSATMREFDANCQEYQRNKKRWQEKKNGINLNEVITLSSTLVNAFGLLQTRLKLLSKCLSKDIFSEFWRPLTSSLDDFFLNAVLLAGARFSEQGSAQIVGDIQVLFQIFGQFCVRPSSFFPNLSDAVILLNLQPDDAMQLHLRLSSNSGFQDQQDKDRKINLKEYGLQYLNPEMVVKLLSLRSLVKA